ncbi:MAG: hypothetical protein DRI69_09890 [Bacteroidetes bacterium]|nr:MAG: hypothetical protein DRI69_09890 [Bacteroidota bacterium]
MNVELTIQNIHNESPVLHQMCSQGDIAIVSAMYDVQSGKVNFFI